jgi:hypothetical protein
MSDDVRILREVVGDTLGRFALGDPRVTEDDLIEVVDLDLTLDAQTIEEVFGLHNRRLAELFCTP